MIIKKNITDDEIFGSAPELEGWDESYRGTSRYD